MKATKLEIFSVSGRAMRAFHMAWLAFFVCFFAWFGIAPLMPIIRKELALTPEQIGNSVVASVAITILARLAIGWFCDRYGPRRVYAALLVLGALPVVGIGLARDYVEFLIFRLAIGAIGASFVITQFHTSAMFAPNVVGTANATAAGWGNLGGGVAQVVMPLLVAGFMAVGYSESASWRMALVVPGVAMIVMAVLYLRLTHDAPEGAPVARGPKPKGTFVAAARDFRVWALAVMYGACFGVELTIHNVAALYFHDRFQLGVKEAGLVAGSFGVLALFARSLGGIVGDRMGERFGVRGRVLLLGALLLVEGIGLALFSRTGVLWLAVVLLIAFGLFVHMAAGATYSVVPFVNAKAVGSVSGIVGAGGNVGAVLAGLLFRTGEIAAPTALGVLGLAVIGSAFLALLVRFETPEDARVEAAISPVAAE